MSDKDSNTPRVFIARHGETEWTINGNCTGKAEIPLTANGIEQVQGTGKMLVGSGRLIDPAEIGHVFCSPRIRARDTFNLLLGDVERDRLIQEGKVTVTEDIAEWDYGDYEGIKPSEINRQRAEKGLGPWNIWKEGCPNGESAAQVEERLERLIEKIYELQRDYMHGGPAKNVLLVAHGHILRAFTKRWLRYPMDFSFTMMIEPGAIGIMSYAHHSVDEPAILVGMGFPNCTG